MALGSVNRSMFVATAYPGTEMFEDGVVQRKLTESFGIHFDRAGKPIPDGNLHRYVLELGDATKLLHDPRGRPLNFSAMPDDRFLEAREHVAHDQLHRILEMAGS